MRARQCNGTANTCMTKPHRQACTNDIRKIKAMALISDRGSAVERMVETERKFIPSVTQAQTKIDTSNLRASDNSVSTTVGRRLFYE